MDKLHPCLAVRQFLQLFQPLLHFRIIVVPEIDFAVLVIGIVEEIVGISHRHGDYIIESDIKIPRSEEGCFFKILNLDINADLLQLSLHFRSNGSYRGALINGKLYSKRLPVLFHDTVAVGIFISRIGKNLFRLGGIKHTGFQILRTISTVIRKRAVSSRHRALHQFFSDILLIHAVHDRFADSFILHFIQIEIHLVHAGLCHPLHNKVVFFRDSFGSVYGQILGNIHFTALERHGKRIRVSNFGIFHAVRLDFPAPVLRILFHDGFFIALIRCHHEWTRSNRRFFKIFRICHVDNGRIRIRQVIDQGKARFFRLNDDSVPVNSINGGFQETGTFIHVAHTFQGVNHFLRCHGFPIGEGHVLFQCDFPGQVIYLFKLFSKPGFNLEAIV